MVAGDPVCYSSLWVKDESAGVSGCPATHLLGTSWITSLIGYLQAKRNPPKRAVFVADSGITHRHFDCENLYRVGPKMRVGYYLNLVTVIGDIDALVYIIALRIKPICTCSTCWRSSPALHRRRRRVQRLFQYNSPDLLDFPFRRGSWFLTVRTLIR